MRLARLTLLVVTMLVLGASAVQADTVQIGTVSLSFSGQCSEGAITQVGSPSNVLNSCPGQGGNLAVSLVLNNQSVLTTASGIGFSAVTLTNLPGALIPGGVCFSALVVGSFACNANGQFSLGDGNLVVTTSITFTIPGSFTLSNGDTFIPDSTTVTLTNVNFGDTPIIINGTVVPANGGGETPVPEPATLALLGAGLAGLSLLKRKQVV